MSCRIACAGRPDAGSLSSLRGVLRHPADGSRDLLRDTNGAGIIGGRILLDGQDITGIAASVFHPEPVTGGIAFRSINLPMGVLGLGMHIFEVSLSLSDGSQTRAAAVWNVLRSR